MGQLVLGQTIRPHTFGTQLGKEAEHVSPVGRSLIPESSTGRAEQEGP